MQVESIGQRDEKGIKPCRRFYLDYSGEEKAAFWNSIY